MKETLAQVFSYEFCYIFENTFLYKTPLVAASEATFQLHQYHQQHLSPLHWSFKKVFWQMQRSHGKMINFAIYFQIKQFKMNGTLALNISMVFFIHVVLLPMSRSSHRSCSIRKDVLKNFAKFTGEHFLI